MGGFTWGLQNGAFEKNQSELELSVAALPVHGTLVSTQVLTRRESGKGKSVLWRTEEEEVFLKNGKGERSCKIFQTGAPVVTISPVFDFGL